ncbi:MAG: hypothetical protein SF172_13635 [Burkholderiales bacterium]|nr:hypothetical protein [Burkholderiales bacterium]
MKFRRTLLCLALATALPAMSMENGAIPMLEQEFEIEVSQTGGTTIVEVNGQQVQGDEARKYAEEARRHAEEARKHAQQSRERVRAQADSIREEVRLRMPANIVMPDVSGLGEAISNSVAYSFTTGNVKSIKNAPYSGEVINERIQTLPDGNQLVKKSSNRVFRDSQGATRQEILDGNGQLKVVHIRDAEGTRFVLTPAKKSAMKIGTPKSLVDGKIATFARKPGPEGERTMVFKSDNGETVVRSSENIVVKRIDADGKEKREEIRVQVSPRSFTFSGNGGLAALGELGKLGELADLSELNVMSDAFAAAGDAFAMAWRHGEPNIVRMDKSFERTTTSLGTRNFDGVIAEGKMVSYTIPAGKVGNVRPITVSTETWYSPDLQITVYSKHSDPRSGDVIYRVANLKRSEQSAELFRVPADYDVQDPLGRLAGAVKIERIEKK